MNRRTWTLLIVAVAVIGGVYAITVWQRTRETRRLLEEYRSADHAIAAQAMTTLRERVPSVREELMKDVSESAGPARWRAVELLAEVHDAASRDLLITALQDADPEVRAAAVSSLGKRRVAGAADRIALLAQSDEEPMEVRLAAVRSLRMLGTVTHLAELSEIATNRPPPKPEEPAEPAPEAEEAEAEEAEAEEAEAEEPAAPEPPAEPEEPWSDDTIELRIEAVRAVATLGAEGAAKGAAQGDPALEAASVLAEACSPEEHNDEVRQAACYAIADLATRVTDEEVRGIAADALLKAATDEIGDVRIAAVHSLEVIPVPADRRETVDSALANAINDEHYWVRVAAGEEPIGG